MTPYERKRNWRDLTNRHEQEMTREAQVRIAVRDPQSFPQLYRALRAFTN